MIQLQDFIVVVPNAVPSDICDEIVNEYRNGDDWVAGQVQNGVLDLSVRNCSGVGLSSNNVIIKNLETRKNIDQKVFNCASYALNEYKKKHPTCKAIQDTGYNLLRYTEGQFYGPHTDSFPEQPRELSCSFTLNDEFTGGEFAFFDENFTYNLNKGDALLFPANFMFPHEVKKVTSGTRYSIITWFT